jgi:hypothetical protein
VARARIDRLRIAERHERYRLAQRAAETVESSRRALGDLERYGDQDLAAWHEAVAAVREAAAVAKSAEHETHRLLDEQTLGAEEQRKREIAADRARAQLADCTSRDLDGVVERARLARAGARLWSLWRTPLAIAGTLLLALAVGLAIEAIARQAFGAGVPLGLIAGACAVGGLGGAALSIFATSRIRAAQALEERALAACSAVLNRALTLRSSPPSPPPRSAPKQSEARP